MESSFNYYKEQYELVRESRAVLFNYCSTISERHLLSENNLFGRGGSIRNLLVHIANTYEFWIAQQSLDKNVVFTTYNSVENIGSVIKLFNLVDNIMYEFIALFEKQGNKQIHYEIGGVKNTAEAFKLFSHVVTHEFHHRDKFYL